MSAAAKELKTYVSSLAVTTPTSGITQKPQPKHALHGQTVAVPGVHGVDLLQKAHVDESALGMP